MFIAEIDALQVVTRAFMHHVDFDDVLSGQEQRAGQSTCTVFAHYLGDPTA
jgi:hypothetical protein